MDMQNLTLFAGIGAVAGFWGQIKSTLKKFFSFFIRSDEINNYTFARNFSQEIFENSKVLRWGNKKYEGGFYFVKKFNVWSDVLQVVNSSYIVLWKNKIPIIISETSGGVKVTYLFHTFPFKNLLSGVYQKFVAGLNGEKKTNNYFYVDEISGKTPNFNSKSSNEPKLASSPSTYLEEKDSAKSGVLRNVNVLKNKSEIISLDYSDIGNGEDKKTEDYYWSKEGLDFYNEVKFWLDSEDWFNKRGIAHRAGICLYGKPGGGKSRLVLETARKLDIPLIKLNIGDMSGEEFLSHFQNAEKNSIVLLEDIECVFRGRKNVLSEGSLNKNLISFDVLINAISGVKQKNNLMICLTTNEISALDPALLRDGRCDSKIELKELDEKGRKFIAKNILCDWPELMEQVINEGNSDMAASFEARCVKIAREKYYSEKIIRNS